MWGQDIELQLQRDHEQQKRRQQQLEQQRYQDDEDVSELHDDFESYQGGEHEGAEAEVGVAPKEGGEDEAVEVDITGLLSMAGLFERADTQTDEDTIPPPPPSSQFDMAQRFESIKTAVLGALSGGIAVTPVTFLHCVLGGAGGLAQWEFATDMSSLEAALFAIVYRYAARANDNNPMLNQGVVGAFVVVRTLSNIQVTPTCSAVPLQCNLLGRGNPWTEQPSHMAIPFRFLQLPLVPCQ